MALRTLRTEDAATLNSLIPHSMKNGVNSVFAPDSPQTPTHMPAAWALRAVISIRRSTAGSYELKMFFTLAFILSAAMVYWVRS